MWRERTFDARLHSAHRTRIRVTGVARSELGDCWDPPFTTKEFLRRNFYHDGAEALGIVLDQLGCEVRLAHSGREAIEDAPAFEPELVILDVNMPGMDGIKPPLN